MTELERINNKFDAQIATGQHPIHKYMFNIGLHISIRDWKGIRSGDFYETRDKMKDPVQKRLFTLQRIKDYYRSKY